ncbi:hypothetical protein [Adhaeribacter aquaticus]|uniref:hypothetical protein n=1 Tax=Adhaeribacter aquaticus TaxID=299567 RepID=UPI0003F59A22|nr:hypothetical protein [Adhaeribacter aquaticus]
MKHRKLHTNHYLEIEYNLIDDIITGNWIGPQTESSIKAGYEDLSFFMQQQVCHKLLDNHLEVKGIWVDGAGWMAYDWHPRAEKNGLIYHACVYSRDTFSRLSTHQAIHMVEKGIIEGFDTREAAENWLKAV